MKGSATTFQCQWIVTRHRSRARHIWGLIQGLEQNSDRPSCALDHLHAPAKLLCPQFVINLYMHDHTNFQTYACTHASTHIHLYPSNTCLALVGTQGPLSSGECVRSSVGAARRFLTSVDPIRVWGVDSHSATRMELGQSDPIWSGLSPW